MGVRKHGRKAVSATSLRYLGNCLPHSQQPLEGEAGVAAELGCPGVLSFHCLKSEITWVSNRCSYHVWYSQLQKHLGL